MARKSTIVRKWLNKLGHHTTAFIHSINEPGSRKDEWSGPALNISISDCDRKVHFGFSFHYPPNRYQILEYKNDIYKLNTLINTLIRARDQYIRDVEEYIAHWDSKEKEKEPE